MSWFISGLFGVDGERSKKMRDRAQQNSRSNFFIALNSMFNDVLSDRLFLYKL